MKAWRQTLQDASLFTRNLGASIKNRETVPILTEVLIRTMAWYSQKPLSTYVGAPRGRLPVVGWLRFYFNYFNVDMTYAQHFIASQRYDPADTAPYCTIL